jgi:hypothetical protein
MKSCGCVSIWEQYVWSRQDSSRTPHGTEHHTAPAGKYSYINDCAFDWLRSGYDIFVLFTIILFIFYMEWIYKTNIVIYGIKHYYLIVFLSYFKTFDLYNNLHWACVVGYGPISLCVIHKDGLCPSSGHIKRLIMINTIQKSRYSRLLIQWICKWF